MPLSPTASTDHCGQPGHIRLPRRQFLQIGGLGLLGISMADMLRLQAEATPLAGHLATAKSVVFIFQSGGPSQHETFDPKPDAPDKIRGEYGVIPTRTPGSLFCEHLPRLASRSDRFSIVRTMHHIAPREFRNEHNSCMYLLHTGTTALPPGDTNASIATPRPGRLSWPSIGSMISYATGRQQTSLPDVVELPRGNLMSYPGREPGLIGPSYDRLGVDLAPVCHSKDPAGSCPNCFSHDDPNDPKRAPGPGPNAWWDNSSCRNPAFHLPDFGIDQSLSLPTVSGRTNLIAQMDQFRRQYESAAKTEKLLAWDAHRHQAMQFLSGSGSGRNNPFELSAESPRTLDLYGREEWGQGFLVARRLVEAGVRMVQVNLRGWDTHQNAFRDLKAHLLPSIDHCLSGFLDDLQSRGLLDETLVVMCGEMGRTPIISPISAGGKNASGEVFTAGRHHWGDVFPCFFAGGGIQPGRIIGQTDPSGGRPVSQAYTPEDLAATIFHCLGIGPDREFHDPEGRPYRIYRGEPIRELLA